MHLRTISRGALLLVVTALAAGCGSSSGGSEESGRIAVPPPSEFVAGIDNPYFPHEPGTTFIYEGLTSEGFLRTETVVTTETEVVMGVTCMVVRSTEYVDGTLAEETDDWYAQDSGGTVWYFGEASQDYDENGDPVDGEGSWRAGEDGAEPGIIMPGNPMVGQPAYHQEYHPGVAEDMAVVEDLNASVDVPYGSFDPCLQTREFSPLDPTEKVLKYYAPEVGHVLETALDGSDRFELIEVIYTPF